MMMLSSREEFEQAFVPGNPFKSALALAAQGYPVFPCNWFSKSPRTDHGFKDATCEIGKIAAMDWNNALVAIATGEASGVDVIDIDPGGRLPVVPPLTFAYGTRRQGSHLWLHHTPGMRKSESRIAPNVDVRADGGYAIAWFAHGYPILCDAALADWSDELRLLAIGKPGAPTFRLKDPEPLGAVGALGFPARRMTRPEVREISGMLGALQNAPEGTRNATLNWASFYIGVFVARGLVQQNIAVQTLRAAARACGLEEPEISKTMQSAFAAVRRKHENGQADE